MTSRLSNNLQEKQLFHGTGSTEVMKNILLQCFDHRVHSNTAFGKGCYFAGDASYSHGYTGQSQDGIHRMFVAQVLVGKMCIGNGSYVRPPPIDPQFPYDLYDTCVNNVGTPSIFVVFENSQCYPGFLIEYVPSSASVQTNSKLWIDFCTQANSKYVKNGPRPMPVAHTATANVPTYRATRYDDTRRRGKTKAAPNTPAPSSSSSSSGAAPGSTNVAASQGSGPSKMCAVM